MMMPSLKTIVKTNNTGLDDNNVKTGHHRESGKSCLQNIGSTKKKTMQRWLWEC